MKKHAGYVPSLEGHREKVTVTLRPRSVEYADRKARERGVSRSEAIDAMIAETEEREVETLMVAGYKSTAQENIELAEEGMESFCEVIKEDSAWPDAPERPNA